MNSRLLLAAPAAALVLAASPAVARDSETARLADKMRDPAMQRQMSAAIAAMSEAMLDMPLEPLARAAEAMGDRRTAREMRGARLGDIAGPEARDVPREVARKLPRMMGAAGGMADAIDEMAPALKDMARQMGARMTEAMREGEGDARRNDDRDRRDGPAARNDDAPPPSAQEEPDGGPYARGVESDDDTQP